VRKVISILIVAVAVVAATSGLASGKATHAHSSAALCGTLYTPPCTPPKAVITSIVACKAAGSTVTFPIRVSANAGLKKVVVTYRGKAVKTIKFTGQPKSKTLSVSIHTGGLTAGVYSVTVRVTDVRGKTNTRTAHFSICHPKPVFTG
jgi:hypothetical protein